VADALKQFQDLAKSNPDNAEIKLIISNMQQGKPASKVQLPADKPAQNRPGRSSFGVRCHNGRAFLIAIGREVRGMHQAAYILALFAFFSQALALRARSLAGLYLRRGGA